jgi:hypothetical protein
MFPNQTQFGKDIADAFLKPDIFSILAVALTQSGKTGSMLSVKQQVPHDHFFLITGLSSVEWMEQTKARFPKHLRDSIFHRNQLHRFVQKVKGLTNVLVIIDENQIAFKENQTIHKSFLDAGLMDIKDLRAKQVRIVHFTATPTNTDQFFKHSFSDVVFMKQDPAYVSAFDLFEQGRILPYKDLAGTLDNVDYSNVSWKNPDSAVEVHEDVQSSLEEIKPFLGKVPKFHIIRTFHSYFHDVTILNFMKAFKDADFISEMEVDSMDALLEIPPVRHTFLFIKEKLRCAKTLCKDHLGVLYERLTKKPKMNTILQGLVGRLTGYHSNTQSVVFSNPDLVVEYNRRWVCEFPKDKDDAVFIGEV